MKESRNSKDIQVTDGDRLFLFTRDQQEVVCKYFGKDIRNMVDYEIDELLDKAIDDLVVLE
jgi:hypothetical protein